MCRTARPQNRLGGTSISDCETENLVLGIAHCLYTGGRTGSGRQDPGRVILEAGKWPDKYILHTVASLNARLFVKRSGFFLPF